MSATTPIEDLRSVMARLRNPDGGCPWDIEQDYASIAPYTIEEAYEVADAITRNNHEDLRDELGDLLLQVVFHARMAEEDRHFNFDDVAQGIVEKMIRRHPHVFNQEEQTSAAGVKARWDEIKAQEKAEKGITSNGLMDDIPRGFPGLLQAVKLQTKAAKAGFDWSSTESALEKVEEELGELKSELTSSDPARLESEMGDLLFTCVNLARHLGIDPDSALRRTNEKIRQRFARMENASRVPLDKLSSEERQELWRSSKDASPV